MASNPAQDEQVAQLLAQASQLEEEGAIESAGEIHMKTFADFADNPLVQAEFARHFVRHQLGRLVQDIEASDAVAIAFEALSMISDDKMIHDGAAAADDGGDDVNILDGILLERAVFESQIVGDLASARQTFELAIVRNASDAVFYNYANMLDHLGETDKATIMYRKALETNPDHVLSINNLSALLIVQARNAAAAHSDDGACINEPSGELLNEATALLQHAQSLAPGFPAYNLSCVCALRDDEEGCRSWLQLAVGDCPQLTARDISEDEDLSNMNNKEWFVAIVDAVADAADAADDEARRGCGDDDNVGNQQEEQAKQAKQQQQQHATDDNNTGALTQEKLDGGDDEFFKVDTDADEKMSTATPPQPPSQS